MDLVESIDSSTIRVDNNVKKGSVLDLIKMVLRCDSSSANTTLRRLVKDNPKLGTTDPELGVTRPGSIGLQYLRINGKGKETPVADAKTLVEIVWLLPGKKAREFRRQSSEKIVRLLGGDLSLVSEIEARHTTLQSTDEGRSTQAFLLHGGEGAAKKQLSGAPFWFQLMPDEEKKKYALMEAQKHMTLAKKTMALDEMDILAL